MRLSTVASGDSYRAEIVALNRRLNDAFSKRDLNAMMA
jgi:hypothetical protein